MTVPEVDVAGLEAARVGGAVVIDVRNPDEYERAHIPGARLVPLPELAERIDEVPTEREVYVVCAVGSRSARAAQLLRSKGIDAINVAGGTKAWIESGRPTATGSEPA
jgi:rhodanese-related sulfurtransferase